MRPAICVFLLVFTATLAAQPVVYEGGVVNNASYALPGLPNAAIARGSMCAIFGCTPKGRLFCIRPIEAGYLTVKHLHPNAVLIKSAGDKPKKPAP